MMEALPDAELAIIAANLRQADRMVPAFLRTVYETDTSRLLTETERLHAENATLREACAAAVTYISLVCGTERTATLELLRAALAAPAAGE